MKKIGIILRDYKSLSNNDLYGLRSDLIDYLRKYPVQVICIPICFKNNEYEEMERVIKLIDECNGIILPGGANDYEIDLEIVKYLHTKNIPTLGICLGMQIMSLAFHGDLEDFKNNKHQSKEEYIHKVKIKTNSKLAKIIGETKILVNSRHSSYITTTDLSISAISDDLVIEAVEDPTKRFFIGVQWHPESLEGDLYSKKLFDAFINSI